MRRWDPVRNRRLVLILFVIGALAGCSDSGSPRSASNEDLTGRTSTSTTTSTTLLTGDPVDAEDIGAVLDPQGRPYDAIGVDLETVRVETEPLTTLVIPDGTIRTMGGEYATTVPEPSDPTVSFGDARELEASVIWVSVRGTDSPRQVLGIRLDVADTEVVSWKPLETAYGTDGGTGAVVSSTAAATDDVDPAAAEDAMWQIIDDLEASPVVVKDRDETAGDDVIVFENGYGDGGFPMSRGVDEDGETVALVIWDTRYPWRLAVTDGTPPPDVTEREDQLQACLDGERGLVDVGRDGDTALRCVQD